MASKIEAAIIYQRPQVQYQDLAFVPRVTTVPETVTMDKWYQPPAPIIKHPVHNQSFLAVPVFVPISISWYQVQPGRPILRYNGPPKSAFAMGAPAVEDSKYMGWQLTSPIRILRNKVQFQFEARPLPVPAPPETITPDKWFTLSPGAPHHARPQFPQPSAPVFTPVVAPETITLDKWHTSSPRIFPILRYKVQHLSFTINIFPIPNPPPPEPEPEPPPEARRRKPMSVKIAHTRRPFGGMNTIYFVDDEEN